jgi:hypothetical protein
MAPRKSARIVKTPTQIPPKAAAIGMYLLSLEYKSLSVPPKAVTFYSLKDFKTSFGPDPETSIQVLEKTAQVAKMKVM